MTAWRVSIEDRDGETHDLVVENTDESTVGEFFDELSRRDFERHGLLIDGDLPNEHQLLSESPLRHGSHLSRRRTEPAPPPGWFLVAIAGPDTGAWCEITERAVTVGRSASNGLAVHDPALSGAHFTISLDGADVVLDDLGSTNGTELEGQPIDGSSTVPGGAYLQAGSTTFGVLSVSPADIPASSAHRGPAVPFQRRFRDALTPLPKGMKHPTPPKDNSEANRRPLISFLIPVITAVGIATVTGRYIFLVFMALGPIFYAVDSVRRRRIQNRKDKVEREDYEERRERFVRDLAATRRDELVRDRWGAAPAGLAALLATMRHERLWERSSSDDDFCEVAIGLHDRPSTITAEGRPPDTELPMDEQWSAVLRHSLVREGPLAIRGAMARSRALGRSLLLDLATAHSPNDVKIWLITDVDAAPDWNATRWLPHTFAGDSQNWIVSTPAGRASALSQLRSIINERAAAAEHNAHKSDGALALPIHVVMIDCLDALDPAELTDLLVDGAAVGVVGITLDSAVTPEGSRAELTLGHYADEAEFVSRSQPYADHVRSFETTSGAFGRPARTMAGCRPAGSSREVAGGPEVIRLVDLIDAEVDPERTDAVVERWDSTNTTSRVKVGGLGDLVTEIDIMRDGPHGLIGGTTRSGKTEFLKSLITSLAVANHRRPRTHRARRRPPADARRVPTESVARPADRVAVGVRRHRCAGVPHLFGVDCLPPARLLDRASLRVGNRRRFGLRHPRCPPCPAGCDPRRGPCGRRQQRAGDAVRVRPLIARGACHRSRPRDRPPSHRTVGRSRIAPGGVTRTALAPTDPTGRRQRTARRGRAARGHVRRHRTGRRRLARRRGGRSVVRRVRAVEERPQHRVDGGGDTDAPARMGGRRRSAVAAIAARRRQLPR